MYDVDEIQDESTNNCDGDDCSEAAYCSTGARETFTMASLGPDAYFIKLQPYSAGGYYKVQIYCGPVGKFLFLYALYLLEGYPKIAAP